MLIFVRSGFTIMGIFSLVHFKLNLWYIGIESMSGVNPIDLFNIVLCMINHIVLFMIKICFYSWCFYLTHLYIHICYRFTKRRNKETKDIYHLILTPLNVGKFGTIFRLIIFKIAFGWKTTIHIKNVFFLSTFLFPSSFSFL